MNTNFTYPAIVSGSNCSEENGQKVTVVEKDNSAEVHFFDGHTITVPLWVARHWAY